MSRRIATGFLLCAAGAMLALAAATHLYIAAYPYQVNYAEGFVLDDALRLGRLEAIYTDPSTPPYNVSVYTPLYPLLVGILLVPGGPAMAPARALSLISFAALCWMVGSSVARRNGRGAGLAVAVTLGASSAFHPWAALVKPDLLALSLSFAGLYLLERGGEADDHGRGSLPAAALLFAAAIWTKQSLVAAPTAALVWLALGYRQRVLRFALPLAALIAVPAGLLQWASGGWFAHHVISGNANPWAWTRLAPFWQEFAKVHPIVLAVAVIGGIDAVRRRRLGLPALYFAFALPVSLSVGKVGSDHNYLLEPLTAMTWWIGTSIDWRAWLKGPRWRTRAAIATLAVQWALFVPGSLRDARLASATRSDLGRVYEWTAGVPDPVISDEAGLLALNGKPVVLQPFVMAQMARVGSWDDTPLVDGLTAARFNAVILGVEPPGVVATRYTPETREAIARSYAEVGSFSSMGYRYAVMVPRRALPPDDRP